jgi:mRNA-degrading endonuclease RelE of RelBE toxin-antitoxin system
LATMTRRQSYTLVFAADVAKHLDFIEPKYDRMICDAIEGQLRFDPGIETKNRKPLRQPAPFAAHWEIRFGPDNRFRILYDIDEEQRAVQILAIGEKRRDRLIVAGKDVGI